MWLQQLLRGTPTISEVADLWPDTMAVSGLRGAGAFTRIGQRWLERWCDAIYASSDAVVYISPGVGRVLQARGVPRERLHYIPKPADEQAFHVAGRSMRQELNVDPKAVVLLYAGAMGAAQDLGTLVEACSIVDDPRLTVLLAGSGSQEGALRRAVDLTGRSNIRFLGRFPQDRMADLLATADVAFVSLAEHPLSAITMPSKTQAILASGRPILVAANGDLASLVGSSHVGFTALPGNPESIAQAIRALLRAGNERLAEMGVLARRLYATQFSVDRTTDQIEGLLAQVAQAPRRHLSSRLRAQ